MAKGKVKHSVDETQLNLFGDLLNTDEGGEPQEEENGQLRRDGQESSQEVSPETLPTAGEGGEVGGAPGERRADGGGGASAAGIGAGDEAQRGAGDRAPEVHPDTPRGGAARSSGELRNGHTDDRGNYRINVEDKIGAGGKVEKYEENVAAIRLLKQLERESRYATRRRAAHPCQIHRLGRVGRSFQGRPRRKVE